MPVTLPLPLPARAATGALLSLLLLIACSVPSDVSRTLGARCDSSDDDISGTPRRRSLKCVLPTTSSRRTNGVHRSAKISAALAIGQNCP